MTEPAVHRPQVTNLRGIVLDGVQLADPGAGRTPERLAWLMDVSRRHDVSLGRLAEAHVDAPRVKFCSTIKHRRRHTCTIGEVTNQFEIVRDGDRGPHRRKKSFLRHHWRTDAELGRTAAAGGHRLDQQIDIDAGL